MNTSQKIYTNHAKAQSLSELLSMASGEPPMSELAFKGLSYILEDIAIDLEAIANKLKEEDSQHKQHKQHKQHMQLKIKEPNPHRSCRVNLTNTVFLIPFL